MLTGGTRLGPYEILDRLGAGGMGEVYRARDTRLGRDVAVKVLAAGLLHDTEALARFEREARAVAALSHPNILAIHDFAVEQGVPYAVTELLEGHSLRERIEAAALPWRESAEIGVAAAEGLSSAHARGIVHRDLKPENLFVTRDGRLKILDFGLAHTRDDGPARGASATTGGLTRQGAVLGTIGYMSPEQVGGGEVGPPADIFALGCVLYEMVTGRRAFDRQTPRETLAAIISDDPPPIAGTGRQVPREMERVILHCLEKNPSVRFQSAQDLAFSLRAILTDTSLSIGGPRRRGTRARSGRRSVAVLPFENVGAGPDTEYLSDGITEALINSLSALPSLRVVPRATVFRYKGRSLEPRVAGIELNADVLLTGRVLTRGDVLQVQADLVDTASDAQLWGQRYTRQAADVMTIEQELASEISAALRVRLTGEQKSRMARRHGTNVDAYREYLRGRYYWNQWTAEGFRRATECFQRAIDHDPTYALAYAGLSDAIGAAQYYGFSGSPETIGRGRAAALRALELDPQLGEAHAAVAVGHIFHEWDWPGAERECRRAMELSPSYAPAYVYYSLYLSIQCRPAEAVAAARQAEAIDPLSLLVTTGVGWALGTAGDFEGALAQVHRALQINPDFPEALAMLMQHAHTRGEWTVSAQRARRWFPNVGIPAERADALVRGAEEAGRTGYLQALRDVVAEHAPSFGPLPYMAATINAELGDADEAFRWLERCYEERVGAIVFLKSNAAFAPLREDPRYRDMLERLHLA